MKMKGILLSVLLAIAMAPSPLVFAHTKSGAAAGNAGANTQGDTSGGSERSSSQSISVGYQQQPPRIGIKPVTDERVEKQKKRARKNILGAMKFMQDNAIFKPKKKKPDLRLEKLIKNMKLRRDLLLLAAPGNTAKEKNAYLMNDKAMQEALMLYRALTRKR